MAKKITGKSLSEALILISTNPQYDNKLFNDLQVQYKKITPLDTMEMENLRKKLPGISINKEYVIIATPNGISNADDGLWEIKAKQQELFTPKKIRT